MIDVSDLVEFYTQLKRVFFNKPFIKKPRDGSKDWSNLTILARMLDEINAPYEEYLMVQIRAYKMKHVFPSPAQLVGEKAMARYQRFVKAKYRMGQLYKADPTSVVVFTTNIYYPIEEFTKRFDSDIKAMMIFTYVREGKTEFPPEKLARIWETSEYLLAKYEWFGQALPNSLKAWKEKIDEAYQKSHE